MAKKAAVKKTTEHKGLQPKETNEDPKMVQCFTKAKAWEHRTVLSKLRKMRDACLLLIEEQLCQKNVKDTRQARELLAELTKQIRLFEAEYEAKKAANKQTVIDVDGFDLDNAVFEVSDDNIPQLNTTVKIDGIN